MIAFSILVAFGLLGFPRAAKSPWRVVAGTGKSGFGGDTFRSFAHGFAIESKLNSPWGLALDLTNNRLYIADTLNNAVRCVDLTTGLLETIAGTGEPGFSGDGDLAASARLYMPTGLALDTSTQTLYVSDTHNHRVRSLDLRVGRVYEAEDNTSVAPALPPAVLHGPEAQYTCPNAGAHQNVTALLLGSKFCKGSTGKGYAMYLRSTRDRIGFNIQATVGAGEYELRFRYADRHEAHERGARLMRLYVNNVVRTHAFEFRPTGVLQDGRRDVFGWAVISVTLTAGQNVVALEVTGQGGPHIDHLYVVPPRPTIATVAGTGTPGPANDLASAVNALTSPLHTPLGLVVDSVGKLLYIADADNGRVRRLDIAAGTISTIAGGSATGSTRDGEQAKTSKMFRPSGLALDNARRYLYVADSLQSRIRRIDLTATALVGGTVTTVTGFGIQQAPFNLSLHAPQDVVWDGSGSGVLMISDRDSARIRVADLGKPQCPSPEASRLECAQEGITPASCVALGCCYDAAHQDCKSEYNPDGRFDQNFQPEVVLTKVDGKERSPKISFVETRSGRCCYPKLHETATLELLDAPQGLAWDHVSRALYVSQPKQHRVAKLVLSHGRCSSRKIKC